MNDFQKKQIQEALNAYCEKFPSQAKAVNSLVNVGEATIINIRKDKWQNISDEMWRNVGKQIGWSENKQGWQIVRTSDFKKLELVFADAQKYANVYAVTGAAGSGKSASAKYYASNNQNAFHLSCAEYFNRKMFLAKLLEVMGKDNLGYNVSEMMDYVVGILRKMENPIIILDEADKLNDQVLYFFITLYNQLEGKCAIVLMATEFLEKRIKRGLKLNKKGYAEIYSRIGRKFLTLGGTTKGDILAICEANGITDQSKAQEIFNDCEGDLRRVERNIHKYFVLTEQNNAQKTLKVA